MREKRRKKRKKKKIQTIAPVELTEGELKVIHIRKAELGTDSGSVSDACRLIHRVATSADKQVLGPTLISFVGAAHAVGRSKEELLAYTVYTWL